MNTESTPPLAPMDGPTLAARLSRLSATARWRADLYDLVGRDERADLWRTIELMADVLLRIEGLDARDYRADLCDEHTFVREARAECAHIGGSVGGLRTRHGRRANDVAEAAMRGLRESLSRLLDGVA